MGLDLPPEEEPPVELLRELLGFCVRLLRLRVGLLELLRLLLQLLPSQLRQAFEVGSLLRCSFGCLLYPVVVPVVLVCAAAEL